MKVGVGGKIGVIYIVDYLILMYFFFGVDVLGIVIYVCI